MLPEVVRCAVLCCPVPVRSPCRGLSGECCRLYPSSSLWRNFQNLAWGQAGTQLLLVSKEQCSYTQLSCSAARGKHQQWLLPPASCRHDATTFLALAGKMLFNQFSGWLQTAAIAKAFCWCQWQLSGAQGKHSTSQLTLTSNLSMGMKSSVLTASNEDLYSSGSSSCCCSSSSSSSSSSSMQGVMF
jgi:hypothetical protein